MKKSKRLVHGFTLIELLIVIAIIGILSSIVVASLNSARIKGSDAAAKADMHGLRAQADVFYDNSGQLYTGVCSDTHIVQAIAHAATTENIVWASTADNSATATCTDAADTWMAYVQLGKGAGDYWCVDSTGNTVSEAASPGATATACP